ncbi:hypothetical protein MD535_24600 [Vibrio sp. ZSDZ65]|uniref:Uncharacterized protein n=1 Tax=Vibrio qingdaonensis TaxID=2829491 RepID=A0A9X3CTD3_9VIBR|nr:hypothetical protein [Vibrio qingdaonensis]MCW8349171.1 hypothetical protein [Vibrio qingdaonensis]
MTQPNATPTLSTLQNSDPRFAVGHASPPKNDISRSRALLANFEWNVKEFDVSIHTEVFVSCDGHPFDEDDKKTNWRVCAWEKSVNEEQAGSVVLHKCGNAKEARALVNAVIESGMTFADDGISLVLHSERDYEQAKAELAFLKENLSELSASDIDAFYQRVAELSHAIEIWESIQTEPGFTIAKDSNITPQELAQSGFVMKDFKFYPSNFSEVKKRVELHVKNGTLNDSFVILDVSTSNKRIYSFDRCPF